MCSSDLLNFSYDYNAWQRPAVFDLIQELGDVPEEDMRRTFNLGIGLVAAVPGDKVGEAETRWRSAGEEPIRIGRVHA